MLKILLKAGAASGLIAHVCETARAAPVAVVLDADDLSEWQSTIRKLNGDPACAPALFLPFEEVPLRYKRVFVIDNEAAFETVVAHRPDALLVTLCWLDPNPDPAYPSFDAIEQIQHRSILIARRGHPRSVDLAARRVLTAT